MLTSADQYWRDSLSRRQFNTPRFLRLVDMRYRQIGILLPFGSSSKGLDTRTREFPSALVRSPRFRLSQSNTHIRALYSPPQPSNEWIMRFSAGEQHISGCDPFKYQEKKKRLGLAKNDAHGALFYKRRGMIEAFSRHLPTLQINFVLYHVDTKVVCHVMRTAPYHRKGL